MNTENNSRYKETEEKIVKAYGTLAFKKPVDKITVSDICREAAIHRTTFYGHFEDMQDLQILVETVHFKKSLDSFSFEKEWSLYDYILSLLKFYYNYQQLLKNNLLNPTAESRLEAIVSTNLSSNFEQSYKRYFKITSMQEMRYHQTYITTGAVAVIKKWVLSGCRETPEEMADILCDILEK